MEKTNEKCECNDCCKGFSWQNGFRFGLGFVLATILGWAILAFLVWIIIVASQYVGTII